MNGSAGAIAAMERELLYVIEFTIRQEKITKVDLISILSRTAANLYNQK
ncbi:hypothetical protein [Paenibacillus sp. TAF43_2]